MTKKIGGTATAVFCFCTVSNWFASFLTLAASGYSMQAGTAPITMALVFACISIIYPLIMICIWRYGGVVALAEFVMFALWLTSTCFCIFYVTTCQATGTKDLACRGQEVLLGLSAFHSLLHFTVTVIWVVYDHAPSPKQGAPEHSSGRVLDGQADNGNLELGVVVVAPEAGDGLEVDTIVLNPETAEDVKIETIVIGPEEHSEYKEKGV